MDTPQHQSPKHYVVTVNGGSSSIKVAVFDVTNMQQQFTARIENIGQQGTQLIGDNETKALPNIDQQAAGDALLTWLTGTIQGGVVVGVGHRIVHGGPHFYKPTLANEQATRALEALLEFDPEHLPAALNLLNAFTKTFPHTPQILCFDTAFHHDLPTKSRLLPVPRALEAKGVRRYGFHGLSYEYIMDELRRVEGEVAANGKIIIAHLGSGASVAALEGGKPIDTTMSMTPTSGIPMSTRSGDLDPGLLAYIAQSEGYDRERLQRMVNFESGLLGISETTADMKQLLDREATDSRAEDAVDIFCYHVTKTIGAFTAAMGGLNTLVFTGGIGEQAPKIRARVCSGLDFLGITLDDTRNQANERLISVDGGATGVHVIHTNEAATIAKHTAHLLQQGGKS